MKFLEWTASRWSLFVIGFKLPFKAGKLILQHKKLLIFSLIPIAITAIIYIYIIANLQNWIDLNLQELFVHWGLDKTGWVLSFLTFFMRILLLIASALTFSLTATIVASPFNDFLSEFTEKIYYKDQLQTLNFSWSFKLLWIDLIKTFAVVITSILAFILSWIPIVNIFIIGLSFLLLCFQFVSYSFTRRGFGTVNEIGFIWKNLFTSLGFGFALAILFSIPLISILILPLAVVGGTLFVCQYQSLT